MLSWVAFLAVVGIAFFFSIAQNKSPQENVFACLLGCNGSRDHQFDGCLFVWSIIV